MKTKLIILTAMLALSARAVLPMQYVDRSTPGTVPSSSSGLISLTNITLLSGPGGTYYFNFANYATTNSAYPTLGDLLPEAFYKLDLDATNVSTAVLTNGGIQGEIAMITNSPVYPGGFAWVTMPSGGGGTTGGADTNFDNIGANATNVISSIAAGAIPTAGWATNGNYAVPGSVLGTSNNQALQLVANGSNVVKYSYPTLNNELIVAGFGNSITPDSATVSNRNSAILSGTGNNIAGTAFTAPDDGRGDVIVGGDGNTNLSTGFGYIGTGWNNLLSSYPYEFIGNGRTNSIRSVSYGFIGNGFGNELTSYGGGPSGGLSYGCCSVVNGRNNTNGSYFGLIGGGQNNSALTSGGFPPSYPFIGNGLGNVISNGAWFATILNGSGNLIYQNPPSGGQVNGSTVLGGTNNIINGVNSFVSGSSVNVQNNNVFAFGDGSAPLATSANNQFLVQATGGAEFLDTVVDAAAFTVNGAPLAGSSTNASQGVDYVQTIGGYGSGETFTGTNIMSGCYFENNGSYTVSGYYVQTNNGAPPQFGGAYLLATNNGSYFTNIYGMDFCLPDTGVNPAGVYIIETNGFGQPVGYPFYLSTVSVGRYSAKGHSLGVQYQGSFLTVTFSNFIPANTQMAVNTNTSASTNTLFVNGSVQVLKGLFADAGLVVYAGTTNSIGLLDTNGTSEVLYLYASTNSGVPTLYVHGSGNEKILSSRDFTRILWLQFFCSVVIIGSAIGHAIWYVRRHVRKQLPKP